MRIERDSGAFSSLGSEWERMPLFYPDGSQIEGNVAWHAVTVANALEAAAAAWVLEEGVDMGDVEVKSEIKVEVLTPPMMAIFGHVELWVKNDQIVDQ